MTTYSWSTAPGNGPFYTPSGMIYWTVPGSTGGVLSKQQIYALLRTAGFDQAGAVRMLAISGRESKGTYVSNILSDQGENTDYSIGIWQNNYLGSQLGGPRDGHPSWPNASGLASSPLAQAVAAYQLYTASLAATGNGFNPWSTNAGLSSSLLADAQNIANQVDASGNLGQLVAEAQAIGGGAASIDTQNPAVGSVGSAVGGSGSSGSSGGGSGSTDVGAIGSGLGNQTGGGGAQGPGWNPITGLVNIHIPFGLAWGTLFVFLAGAALLFGVWLAVGHPTPSLPGGMPIPIPV